MLLNNIITGIDIMGGVRILFELLTLVLSSLRFLVPSFHVECCLTVFGKGNGKRWRLKTQFLLANTHSVQETRSRWRGWRTELIQRLAPTDAVRAPCSRTARTPWLGRGVTGFAIPSPEAICVGARPSSLGATAQAHARCTQRNLNTFLNWFEEPLYVTIQLNCK